MSKIKIKTTKLRLAFVVALLAGFAQTYSGYDLDLTLVNLGYESITIIERLNLFLKNIIYPGRIFFIPASFIFLFGYLKKSNKKLAKYESKVLLAAIIYPLLEYAYLAFVVVPYAFFGYIPIRDINYLLFILSVILGFILVIFRNYTIFRFIVWFKKEIQKPYRKKVDKRRERRKK